MYLHTIGGSALIHLLVGYPRLILLLGIAGTVALTGTPHGPGRYAGTGHYLAEVNAAVAARTLATAAAEARARRGASELIELGSPEALATAVGDGLRRCGSGCTDLSTPIVIHDPELLMGLLILRELDEQASQLHAAAPLAAGLETAQD